RAGARARNEGDARLHDRDLDRHHRRGASVAAGRPRRPGRESLDRQRSLPRRHGARRPAGAAGPSRARARRRLVTPWWRAGMGPAALAAALALPLLLAFGPGLAVPAGAQDAARRAALRERLQATLLRLSADLDGVPGYLMRDLASGESLERNADVVFPVASVIKLPVLLELYRQAEEGTLDLARRVPVDPKARVEGGGVLEKWSA